MPLPRKLITVGLLLGIVAVAGLGAVVTIARHNTAKPVTVGQAIQRFRAHTEAPIDTSALPPPGVYSFRTSGDEEVGLPGGHRDLPNTTTITVAATGCGESEEWAASTQHSESRVLCAD
ncbi:MAG: hypothetical protein JO246_03995, partial [Frankiaceae bacterium]|nr:hypothetical protein [Frankiaceae bacterium]